MRYTKKLLPLLALFVVGVACQGSSGHPLEGRPLQPAIIRDQSGAVHYVGDVGLREAAREVEAQLAAVQAKPVEPRQILLRRMQIQGLREHLAKLRPFQPGLSVASSDLDFVPWSTFTAVVHWSGNAIRYAIRTTTNETAVLQHSGYLIVNGSFAGNINSNPVNHYELYSQVTPDGAGWCSESTNASAESSHHAHNSEVAINVISVDDLQCGSSGTDSCTVDAPGGSSGECTNVSGQGTGQYYFPGSSSDGQRVFWATGEGTGVGSVCGSAAIVQYVCIDLYVNGAWQEWSCGFATTC